MTELARKSHKSQENSKVANPKTQFHAGGCSRIVLIFYVMSKYQNLVMWDHGPWSFAASGNSVVGAPIGKKDEGCHGRWRLSCEKVQGQQ